MLLQCTLVGSTLGSVLTVNERVILLTILVSVGKSQFDVSTLQVDDVIQAIHRHIVFQQVFQTVTRENLLTVIYDGKSCIQISIVLEQVLYCVIMIGIAGEEGVVRLEIDIGTSRFGSRLSDIAHEFATFELGYSHHSIAKTAYLKVGTEGIDSLQTYTIKSHTFLECLTVILATRIQLAHGIYHLSLGNASTIVSHTHTKVVLNGNFNTVACSHLELINTIVNCFFQ